MSEYRVVVQRKERQECYECGELATKRITFLLHGSRRNPDSAAYGRDDCTWCSDDERFACDEHERDIINSPPHGTSWCSSFSIEKYPHMGDVWISDEAAKVIAEKAIKEHASD